MFPLSRQRSWEEGWHFWLDHGILYFMTFYLLPDCSQIAKTGKRIKKQNKNSSLFLTLGSDSRRWWLGAFVLEQQNYISGINDYQRTVQAKFDHSLFICFKNQTRSYERNRPFETFCCLLICKQFW